MHQANEITVVASQSGRAVNVLGAEIVIKSSGDPGQFFFADHSVPPDYFVPLHVHETDDEAFYVLEGEITLITREGRPTAGPGSYIHLPRGVPHGFINASGAPARMLVVASAGGRLEALFDHLDVAARQGGETAPPSPAQVGAICAAHGAQMLEAA